MQTPYGVFVDENCMTGSMTVLSLVKRGRVDILKYLLESGANRNLTGHRGRIPFEKFLETKDMKLVQALNPTSSKAWPERAKSMVIVSSYRAHPGDRGAYNGTPGDEYVGEGLLETDRSS